MCPDEPTAVSAAEAELVDLLLEALAALGDAGQPVAANRIAACAFAGLRRRDPGQAQRVNVLMHRLVHREKKNAAAAVTAE